MTAKNDDSYRERSGGGSAVADDPTTTAPATAKEARLQALAEILEGFMFPNFLKAEMAKKGVTKADLAKAAGVHLAYMDAVLDSSLIPTSRVAESMIRALGISAADKNNFMGPLAHDARLFQNHATDKELYVMEALAGTTKETTSQSLLSKLLSDDSSLSVTDLSNGDKTLGNILSKIKTGKALIDDSVRVRRRSHFPKTAERLCDGFGVPKSCGLRNLLIDIIYNRSSTKTVGSILLEAEKDGLSFNQFIRSLMDEFNFGQREVGKLLGFREAVISRWLRDPEWAIHKANVPNDISEKLSLNRFEDHAIWRLTRGKQKIVISEKELGSVEEIIAEAKRILAEGTEDEKKGVPSKTLKWLLEYTGFTALKVVEKMSSLNEPDPILEWIKTEKLTLKPIYARELASVFIIEEKRADESVPDWKKRLVLRGELENIFHGVTKQKTPEELLSEAMKNISTVARSNPDAVLERFGYIIDEILKFRPGGAKKFGEDVDYKDPKKKIDGQGVSCRSVINWREGKDFIGSRLLASAVADLIGYKGENKATFIQLALGRPVFYDPSILEDCISGKIGRTKALRMFKTNAGLSSEELFSLMEVSRSTLSNMENGGLIGIDIIWRMVDLYKIPEEDRAKFVEHFSRTPENLQAVRTEEEAAEIGKPGTAGRSVRGGRNGHGHEQHKGGRH